MSSCTLSYLNKTNLPLSEKERLTELHNQIFEELKQSKYLRKYKGQLVMPKHGYDVRWASADIKRVNERYGDKVVSVIYDRSDKYFKAMVDVLKTIKPNEGIDITMQVGNQYFAGGEVFPTYEDAQSFKEKVEQEYVQMEINRLFEAGELQIDCNL